MVTVGGGGGESEKVELKIITVVMKQTNAMGDSFFCMHPFPVIDSAD